MNKLTILLVLAFITLSIAQNTPLPVISGFSFGAPTELVHVDLNALTLSNITVGIPDSISIYQVINSTNPDYLYLFYNRQEKMSIDYFFGKYYYANNSLVRHESLALERLHLFEYFQPFNFYDYQTNQVSMSGWNGSCITIVTYDIASEQVFYLYTPYTTWNKSAPIGGIGVDAYEVITFFYNGELPEGNGSIIITNTQSQQSTVYVIENFEQFTIYNSPYNWPFSIGEDRFLCVIDYGGPGGNVYLYQIFLSDYQTAQLKLLYTFGNAFVGGQPLMWTEDKKNIIFIGSENRQNDVLVFVVYNLETNLADTVFIPNSLNISISQFNAWYNV
ncbi:hypothetical protein DLAC_06469 [Tieghemostelium lacteum]|uniref:TolB protein n=1 Tax=Tieghemostelium lacteum TaxID=361077 RepID=A0A151ZEV0_TIELA|nr:hypothetical protein DLAC_06469 [Tieghemostelium lacteum]|eukprot:KYQ92486.1 hypothetical protein DLAC_06469 [Tieghemostelium lacteum]